MMGDGMKPKTKQNIANRSNLTGISLTRLSQKNKSGRCIHSLERNKQLTHDSEREE